MGFIDIHTLCLNSFFTDSALFIFISSEPSMVSIEFVEWVGEQKNKYIVFY
jgi:hypothetical protein